MGSEEGSELAVAKQQIVELEALVASLHRKIQILESDNIALRELLLYYEKVKLDHGILKQRPMETQATPVSPLVCVEEHYDEGCKIEDRRKSLDKDHDKNDFVAVKESEILQDCQTDVQVQRVQPTETDQSGQSSLDVIIVPTTTDAKREKDDMSHHSWRHIALKIMYTGARFHGFASTAATKRTVEEELFAALERTKLLMRGRLEAKYSRCGRTDKGVSANGQVVALLLRSQQKSNSNNCLARDSESNLSSSGEDRVAAAKACHSQESIFVTASDKKEIDYVGVLNRALPLDIRVLGWCPVPNGFHARFSCISREYKYFFVNDGLDIEAMRVAGHKFEGEHDFRNFCKMDAENVHSFIRRILTFEIIPCRDRWAGLEIWVFRVKGTAFLWHQVRCMVAILLLIGERNESPSIVDDLLNIQKTPRKPQYVMAPDTNLALQSCEFQGLSFFCAQGTARLICMHFQKLLREHLLAAAMLKEAYEQLLICSSSDLSKQGLQKKILHVPLSCRPTEPSYDERRSKIQSGKQKIAKHEGHDG